MSTAQTEAERLFAAARAQAEREARERAYEDERARSLAFFERQEAERVRDREFAI